MNENERIKAIRQSLNLTLENLANSLELLKLLFTILKKQIEM